MSKEICNICGGEVDNRRSLPHDWYASPIIHRESSMGIAQFCTCAMTPEDISNPIERHRENVIIGGMQAQQTSIEREYALQQHELIKEWSEEAKEILKCNRDDDDDTPTTLQGIAIDIDEKKNVIVSWGIYNYCDLTKHELTNWTPFIDLVKISEEIDNKYPIMLRRGNVIVCLLIIPPEV